MSKRTAVQHLGVNGQWVLSIALTSSGEDDQINYLNNFTIIEETGNLLPTWEINFQAGKGLEKEWVESAKIPVVLAQSINSQEKLSTNLQILHPEIQRSDGGLYTYSATGVLYAPAFTQTPYITNTKPCAGTSVLKTIGEKHFNNVNTDNMTESQESQSWIQSNTTDKKFADYVVSHCFIPGSFVNVGITSDGTYMIVDPVKLSQKDPDYEIGGENGLTILKSSKTKSNSGIMNAFGGYGMDTPIISQHAGIRTVHRPDVKFSFVQNSHSSIDNISRKTLAPVKCSISNDSKTYMGKANFDMGCAMLSMENTIVTMIPEFYPIKIFDVVNLFAPSDEGQGSLNTNISGKYLITKVTRTVEDMLLYTTVVLSRDAHNETS